MAFDEIMDQLDALALGANRGRNDNKRRLRDDVAQSQPVNKYIHVNHRRQPIYRNDSEEEEASNLPIIGLQEVLVGMFMSLLGMVEISN